MRTDAAAARLLNHSPPAPLEITAEVTAAAWNRFADEIGATGYHSWEWKGVFERAFGHETIYLAATRAGEVEGLLPLVFIDSWLFGRAMCSLPFVNYGGTAAASVEAAAALVVEAVAKAAARRCQYVELRHVERQHPELPCRKHKVAMHLGLAAEATAMWDGLDRKVRNQVRKAQKSNLTVETGGAALLDEFYAVFARNMRDLGTPVYACRFFAEVLAAFPGRTRVHVVRLGSEPVAASITFRTRDTIEVPWASAVRDHNALCPNQLLYWSMIEHAVSERCRTFDFGRSTPNEGTFKFKQQWGAVPVALHWEYGLLADAALPNASPSNPKYRLAIDLWKRLPLGLATRIGPRIVRSIP